MNKNKTIKIASPEYLTCESLTHPQLTKLLTAIPKFGWCIPVGQMQIAYQIIVSSEQELLSEKQADLWNTGKSTCFNSINIKYMGKPLQSNREYYWSVRFWNINQEVSGWSQAQQFITGNITDKYNTVRYPLEVFKIEPLVATRLSSNHIFYDFGKASFATVSFTASSLSDDNVIEVHLGEELSAPTIINRSPKGCIRYRKMLVALIRGTHEYIVKITPDERNTNVRRAILMPDDIGEVMPFRYCEIKNIPQETTELNIQQLAVYYHFDDTASEFYSSDKILNQVWDLCKYSIKATSFCGVYVDGDRERIAYEGDAYINQLSHYGVEREYSLARYSHEYLVYAPTWATEWILSSVMMAWADYMYTGDNSSLQQYYEDLKLKTLMSLARDDGLISTQSELLTQDVLDSIHASGEADHLADLVDWPPVEFVSDGGAGERDGHEMVAINTVVNAYYYHNLLVMAKIAAAVGKKEDESMFLRKGRQVYKSFNKIFFDSERKIYIDGENVSHASLHSNMFALTFGLVPQEYIHSVAEYVKSRGMACSVYGAQYLLEAMYKTGHGCYALELMNATTDRSWYNMLKVGSTVTLEAWDWKYKNNLDWNHAWGAAPANIIPRFLAGVQPLKPGFERILIKPQLGNLKYFNITVPTVRGPVKLDVMVEESHLEINIFIPGNTHAKIDLSEIFHTMSELTLNGGATDCGRNSFEVSSGQYNIRAGGSKVS